MKISFLKQVHHSSLINEHLGRISLLSRIDIITGKDTRQKADRISLVIKYNRFLPYIIWNILQINEKHPRKY